jgi:hypothetical protein
MYHARCYSPSHIIESLFPCPYSTRPSSVDISLPPSRCQPCFTPQSPAVNVSLTCTYTAGTHSRWTECLLVMSGTLHLVFNPRSFFAASDSATRRSTRARPSPDPPVRTRWPIAIITNIAANAHRPTCSLTIGMSDGAIKIVSKQLTGPDSSLPRLAVQIICLVDSYMVWVGATSDGRGEQVEGTAELAPLQGHLARDWACAMPPVRFGHPSRAVNSRRQAETNFGIKVYEGGTATASALFRSADSDAAFSMSQRLGGLLFSPTAHVGGHSR